MSKRDLPTYLLDQVMYAQVLYSIVSKETYQVSKETYQVSKETYQVSKETYQVSKETVSKETY